MTDRSDAIEARDLLDQLASVTKERDDALAELGRRVLAPSIEFNDKFEIIVARNVMIHGPFRLAVNGTISNCIVTGMEGDTDDPNG